MPGPEVPDAGRDRDAAGRPRNARPRDGLGRPLPRGAAGVERVPDDLDASDLTPAGGIELAQRYLDDGRPFHAHEVLEALWKSRAPVERDLWQGLAQVCVGLTHALRGNDSGALTLLGRGAGRLRDFAGRGGDSHGVDVAHVLRTIDAVTSAIGAGASAPDAARAVGPLALRGARTAGG
jgi:hypothetical protein